MRFIHVVASINGVSFLLLTGDAVHVPQLFIHSQVERHLGCSQFGAIINKAATNIHIEIFTYTKVLISVGKYLRTVILGQMITAYLISKQTAEVGQPFCFPNSNVIMLFLLPAHRALSAPSCLSFLFHFFSHVTGV